MSIDEQQKSIVALDAKGLCDILKVCARSNVLSFEYGDLKVRFDYAEQDVTSVPVSVGQARPADPPGQEDSTLQSRFETEQEELDQMLIEDPLGYEERVLSGELESGVGVGH